MKKDLEFDKITDKDILDIFISKEHHVVKSSIITETWLNNHPNIKKYLLSRYPDTISIAEKLYRIENHIDIKPVCKECGKDVVYVNINTGYRKFCSQECARKNQERIQKAKNTKKERYGDEGYHNIEKMKQTCMERYGAESVFSNKEIQEKIKKTCMERYGVDNTLKSKKVRKKIQDTCMKKYGAVAPNMFGSKEYENLIYNKYGVKYVSQNEEIKEKVKNTCLEKYGVTSYIRTEECIKKCTSKEAIHKKYIILTLFF